MILIFQRLFCVVAALIVGWVVYMIAMMMTTYDGVISLVVQPFMAVVCSGLTVLLALLLGLVLKIPFLARWWRARKVWAVLLILLSLFVLCFGSLVGITQLYTNPDTGSTFTGLHSAAALGSYLALLFGIANWPIRENSVARFWAITTLAY